MINKRSKPDIIVMLILILALGATLSGMSQGDNRKTMSQAEMQAAGINIGKASR